MMKYPFLRRSEIQEAAAELLQRTFGQDIPVPVDLDAVLYDVLVEDEQLAFSDEEVLGHQDGDQVLGRMWPHQNRIEVCASLKARSGAGRLKGRYRFTVGHEIGHWVLHRPLYVQPGANGSRGCPEADHDQISMVSLKRNIFANHLVPLAEEVQANRFAAHLLMPASRLRREFIRRFGTPPVVSERGRAAHDAAIQVAGKDAPGVSTPLCDAFEVSRQAMAIALDSRGYVTHEPTLL